MSLHVKDRELRRLAGVELVRSRKSTAEEHRRSFGHDDDALPNFSAEEVRRGRLSSARPSRENDPAAPVAIDFGHVAALSWLASSSTETHEKPE